MSARQFYIVLALSVISMKMQKLPSLIAGDIGKDSWLVFLMFTIINLLGIVIVLSITKMGSVKKLLSPQHNFICNFARCGLMFATSVYFLIQSILLYEHIQGLFANTLFDDLSWSFFSLLLLFAVSYLAHRGVENISLNFELFVWIIVVSFVILAILGTTKCDFSVVLPFETIDFKLALNSMKKYNCWFGDFFLVLYLSLKARDVKISKTMLVYLLSMLFTTFLVVIFVGIYDKTAPLVSGLISSVSEQSLLDLSIGRVDWFLILFTEMGAILSCSLNLYFANLCLHLSFPKAKPLALKLINSVALYILDVVVLVDLSKKITFFCGVMSIFSYALVIITLVVLVVMCIADKNKESNLVMDKTLNKNIKLSVENKKNKSNKKSGVAV